MGAWRAGQGQERDSVDWPRNLTSNWTRHEQPSGIPGRHNLHQIMESGNPLIRLGGHLQVVPKHEGVGGYEWPDLSKHTRELA